MPLVEKTQELIEILREIANTGNILTPRPIGNKNGLYVQFLQNRHHEYYVRDSNDVQKDENTTSMGKPIIFPSCFAIKPGRHTKGWLHRRNIDFMHLTFCKVAPVAGVVHPEVGWASLSCILGYYVWDLPDYVDLTFLEKRLWNEIVYEHCNDAILTNDEIILKRGELLLDLRAPGSTEWKNLRNGNQNYDELFASLIQTMRRFVQQFEVEDLDTCREGMPEDQKTSLVAKYINLI